ncbi:hypothetical protein ABZP36_026669 [Zizania latifolia]
MASPDRPGAPLTPSSRSQTSGSTAAKAAMALRAMGSAVAFTKLDGETCLWKKDCGHAECKEAEIDDWLLQFAELFWNQVAIKADAHLDLHELGMELCSETLEEMVTGEEAQALFEMATVKFLGGNRYEESLKIKQDFYEGLLALGQQHFETAKLHWSFALADKVDLSAWDSLETFKLFDSADC